ncbi:MAG: hypothetical protein EXX96DRAFT_492335 [Benjaminiella poitrasii]|nr:MAG: hypothetical protein EXX96DRAFT_492335 [Benjaminiella poitrasii]
MGDFYTYLIFMGLISVWSIYGLLVNSIRSIGGLTIYVIGLIVAMCIHLIIGLVHILLLFISYQPILMDTCLQRDSSRLFWWSLGYENTAEMKQIHNQCSAKWKGFAIERLTSWVVYSAFSSVCLWIIIRYQRTLIRQRNRRILNRDDDEWSSDEEGTMNKEKRVNSITYHEVEFPTSSTPPSSRDDEKGNEMTSSMYQQRQRLFDEIAKRKRAKKNVDNRKSMLSTGTPSTSNRSSVLIIHPLDLTQSTHAYQPPPMPPPLVTSQSDIVMSWNRYDTTLRMDEEDIERQRRLQNLSAERIEYEMYKTDGVSSGGTAASYQTAESQSDDELAADHRTSSRKRSKLGRWSTVYSETPPVYESSHQQDNEENEHEKLMMSYSD